MAKEGLTEFLCLRHMKMHFRSLKNAIAQPLQATQRWVSRFEKRFRQYPSDWAFMLDKNWARVLAAALASLAETMAPDAKYQRAVSPGQRT